MEKDTVILTRKVQIYLDCDDKEQRSAYFKQLFEWQDMVYRGANMVMTHQYVQEQIKDLIYLRDDVKVKLADFKKDPDGIFTSSKMNTTYRILSLSALNLLSPKEAFLHFHTFYFLLPQAAYF